MRWGALAGLLLAGVGVLLIPLALLLVRRALERHLAPFYGLCGGMCYAALDAYLAEEDLRWRASEPPPPGSVLHTVIWRRQLDSLIHDGPRFLLWTLAMNILPRAWLQRWMLRRWHRQWPRLRAVLDRGRPQPMGLVREGRNVYENHQVLAVGYAEASSGCVTIHVYDPNCPGQLSTIHVTVSDEGVAGRESCNSSVILRGLFCELYSPRAVLPLGAEG
jgi:hypothetical protein